ncbi:MAG: hypothetical protein C5B51_25375 [Terriglobia bacterium]|nr:MAG: hypothetical protein C5B51_25375 [Terriglobia bacterium]
MHLPAQTAPSASPQSDRSIGEVASVDQQRRQIVLKEDKGNFVVVLFADKTALLRIPAGETDIKKASRIAATDIGAGDRLLAVGSKNETGTAVEARTIVVINRTELAAKQQREQEEWQKRGISGIVATVEPADKSLSVAVGEKKYKVQSTDKTEFRRYAADSAKYSDSQSSTLAALRPGDQIRVLGQKDEDALTLTAERVVSGAFQRVAGTITSVKADSGEIRLTDLVNRKPYTVQVTARSTTRQLPLAIANLIAQRLLPTTQGAAAPAAAASGSALAAARNGADVGQLLDRLPPVSLADLKSGNAIVVNGTPSADGTKITAITLISGIEPIANAVPNLLRDVLGGWNLGGGGDLIDLPQ